MPTTDFQPTAEKVGAGWTAKTRGLLVASPNNPTGTLIEPGTTGATLANRASERGGALIVDEIYHGLTYGTDARTALEISDEIIVINSFSKYFGMTGWRLGWLVVPPQHGARCREAGAEPVYRAVDTGATRRPGGFCAGDARHS